MAKKTDFNRQAWMRSVILKNPEIDLEGIIAEFNKGGKRPKKMVPNAPVLSQARASICKRWGVDSIDELPLKRNGEVNVTLLIKKYIDLFGTEVTDADAVPYFAADGITLKKNQFGTGKSQYLRKLKENEAPVLDLDPGQPDLMPSPDENQHKGPRARKKTKGRRRGRKPAKRDEDKTENELRRDRYEALESKIDNLINESSELRNPSLIQALRDARRRASAGVLTHG